MIANFYVTSISFLRGGIKNMCVSVCASISYVNMYVGVFLYIIVFTCPAPVSQFG